MVAGNVATNIQNPISYGCASFDGVDDKISINNLFPNLANTQYSVSFWYKHKTLITTNVATERQTLIGSKVTAPTFDVSLRNSKIAIRYIDGTDDYNVETAQVINQWNHFAFIFGLDVSVGDNKGRVYLYHNNVYIGSATDGFACRDLGSIITQLGDTDNTSNFKGYIRDLRIYEGKFQAADVNRLYNENEIQEQVYRTNTPLRLIAHFKLNGNANNEIGTNNGTVTGTVFVNDNETVEDVFSAARSGATDKYLAEEINGQILTAVINET